MRGEGGERTFGGGSEGGKDVAGAVDLGGAAEGAELGGKPFRALLLEEGGSGDAAELLMDVVDPLLFAGEPEEQVAGVAGLQDLVQGASRGEVCGHSFEFNLRRRQGVEIFG